MIIRPIDLETNMISHHPTVLQIGPIYHMDKSRTHYLGEHNNVFLV